ncbi:L,D-transpeptidase family protein [Paenibacillus sp. EC2-1]|uniref:L,D-transpeptidase family protein n=1 Tax=Paenibacillus sp. EC2-1 TaxID=3388665 RepID=UPI003BEF2B0D
MNNSLYLKRYVETHPDNKMAWYLLGKDYAANGEQGKANYCFNRAEEVYEAFELSKVPSDIWKNYELRLLHLESEKDKKRKRIRRALLTVMLMILALLPSVDAPGSPADLVVYNQVKETEWAGVNQREEGDKRKGPLFTATATRDKKWSSALPQLLTNPDKLPEWTIALGMKRAGQWEIWFEKMPVLYGIHRAESGSIGIQPYKGVGTECDCKPLDDGALKIEAKTWAQRQVHIAVLSEAIQQFHDRNRRLPRSLEELTKPFPNNWLSGRSPEMKRLFPILVSANAGASGTDGEGLLHGQESGQVSQRLPDGYGSSPDGTAFFKQSLEVIIDRKNHRLGVVSGSVLIRNYEVGLGRDEKTPLGDFRISDKVINPNGSATGTYGSRGMQLSDSNYAIHGTQDINSIGGNESEGCIRMHRKDVEELFDLVPMGTKVRIEEGVLPGGLVIPKERFALKHSAEQSNPRKVYHWLD